MIPQTIIRHIPRLLTPAKLSIFITHVLGVCIIFFIPEYLLSISSPETEASENWRLYAKASVYVMAFYINYYGIIEYTLVRNVKPARFFLYNLALIAMGLYAIFIIMSHDHRGIIYSLLHGRDSDETGIMTLRLMRDGTLMILTIGLSAAIKLTYKWIDFDFRKEQNRGARHKEELRQLKEKLHPHFLFNTLNSIYALIDISPDAARTAVHRLSRLMRQMLDDNPLGISLRNEIIFLDNYIQLMKLRLPESVPLHVEFDYQGHEDWQVPPFIFLNLVENAFKHGNTGSPHHAIEIKIVTYEDFRIVCSTTNHINKTDSLKSSGGTGLSNLRRRLELIYGNNATLETSADNDVFTTCLTINNCQNFLTT